MEHSFLTTIFYITQHGLDYGSVQPLVFSSFKTGRDIFIYLTVVGSLIVAPLSGFLIQTPIDVLFLNATLLFDGAILTLTYMTPLAEHFKLTLKK